MRTVYVRLDCVLGVLHDSPHTYALELLNAMKEIQHKCGQAVWDNGICVVCERNERECDVRKVQRELKIKRAP